MSSDQSQTQSSKKNFKRSLSGKGIIVIMMIILMSIVFIGKIIAEIRWNSYLSSSQPSIGFKQIIKDLQTYQKKHKDYPEQLNADTKDTNWRWAISKSGEKPLTENTGITKSGPKRISRFQYRNYEYLYANIGNKETGPMAVMWAVPVWKIEPIGAYLEYTGHLEELDWYIGEWKKEKQTFFVIITPNKYYVWEGVLAPREKATIGLEPHLEPTQEWLKEKRLYQNFAQNF